MGYQTPGERRRANQEATTRANHEQHNQQELLHISSLSRIRTALGQLTTKNAGGTHWMEIARPVGKIQAAFMPKDELIDGIRLNTGRLYHEHPAYWKVVDKLPVWLLPHVYKYNQGSTHPRDEGHISTCYESYALGKDVFVKTLFTHQGYEPPYDGKVAIMDGEVLTVVEHAVQPHSALSPGAAEAIAEALEKIRV